MIKQVVLPKLGENIECGDVLSIRVQEGDNIEQDQELLEIETDKATVPISSPYTGKVIKIHVVAGQTVNVDDPVCDIDESVAENADEIIDDAGPALRSSSTQSLADRPKALDRERSADAAYERTFQTATQSAPRQGDDTIRRQTPVRRERMSRIRQTISENIWRSYSTIPQATNFDDADVTDLEALRAQLRREDSTGGIRLTLTSFIIRAMAATLSDHPKLNASVSSDGLEILYKESVNVGVAVESERGLVVPVITVADRKDVLSIARELDELVERVRTNQFALEDTLDGTITLSNLGAIGGTHAIPIINPPESAILLTGKVQIVAKYIDGAFQPRRIMPLSLSYDHRIVDGADASRFLNDFKSYIESPSRLLLAPT